MLRRVPVLALLATLALASPAHAVLFAGDVVDGPSADIVGSPDLDLARDGTGAVAYVKRDGGVEHVFVSRLVDGRWAAPERIDPGFPAASGEPAVAASDGGALVIAFVADGQLFAVVRPAGATSWPAPVAVAAPAQSPSVDMSINGVAYLAWAGGGQVRAARLERGATTFTPLGAPLNIDPAAAASQPKVAISADGSALAAWTEAGHVYARRIFELRLSTDPQQLDVPSLAGHAGGPADDPDVDMEDDSSFAWVAFREAFDGGQTTRVLARRLVGSAFDDPIDVGGGGFGAEGATDPRVDVSGRGEALFGSSSTGTNTPFGFGIHLDSPFGPAALAGGQAVGPHPQPAIGENESGLLSWMQAANPGDPVELHAKRFDEGAPAEDGAISDASLGGIDPAAGIDSAADRAGDVATVAVQGSGDQRRLVAGGWDRPPTTFQTASNSKWRRPGDLVWGPSVDLWGLTYTVLIDGRPVATSTTNHVALKAHVADGVHRWRVVATDRRGQTTSTRLAVLRLDGTPPRLRVTISGKRKAGKVLKLHALAGDPHGSGVAAVRFSLGDGSAPIAALQVTHAFRRGTFTVRVTAVDRAGNVAVVTKRLRIAK